MIVDYDLDCHVWVAAGKGHMRPIVVEAGSRKDAVAAYDEEFLNQQNEEYHMEQSMGHLSDINSPNWTPTSGYGYEQ